MAVMPEPAPPTPPKAQATVIGDAPGPVLGESMAGVSTSGINHRARPGGSTIMSGLGRADGRQKFAAEELAVVLSHYDLGTIETLQEFARGSRRAPKVIIRAESGLYLLKRRARGKDDPFKVAFCHAIQLHLAQKQFPLPRLIGTRGDNNSMLQWNGAIYELFEFVKGTSYDNSLAATGDAGKVLALFHKLLRDYQPEYEPPHGSYHGSRSITSSLKAIPQTLGHLEPDASDEYQQRAASLVQFLAAGYNEAARRVNEQGLATWPTQIAHSDWHPGNMLFRGSRVVGVIDYDAARIQQRVLDAANGALQFSILGGGDDPTQWPDYLDESRFKRFIRGYDSVPDSVLSRAELRTIPWLMIEALIAEAAIPIAATGSFARMEGTSFLGMVERKVRWIQEHADHLVATVDT